MVAKQVVGCAALNFATQPFMLVTVSSYSRKAVSLVWVKWLLIILHLLAAEAL